MLDNNFEQTEKSMSYETSNHTSNNSKHIVVSTEKYGDIIITDTFGNLLPEYDVVKLAAIRRNKEIYRVTCGDICECMGMLEMFFASKAPHPIEAIEAIKAKQAAKKNKTAIKKATTSKAKTSPKKKAKTKKE